MNNYRVTHRETLVQQDAQAPSAAEACELLGWMIGDCHVRELPQDKEQYQVLVYTYPDEMEMRATFERLSEYLVRETWYIRHMDEPGVWGPFSTTWSRVLSTGEAEEQIAGLRRTGWEEELR